MLVLVANLGSTSFKFKLFDLPAEKVVASGSADRIGSPPCKVRIDVDGVVSEASDVLFHDHGAAINFALASLQELKVCKPEDIKAIGFKAVHGGPICGAVRVTDEVIAIQEQFADVAPAHNPAYIAAMKAFEQKLPGVPQVAAFETAFHQTIPMARQVYAIPHEWTTKLGIRRYGFHGASHRYISTRIMEILGKEKTRRLISCHLGGSSSITGILDGKSIAHSLGMTPQSGLAQNNRVGDFDTFALLRLMKTGLTMPEILQKLAKEGGLLGISGVSNDLRDIEKAAAEGNKQAQLAIDALVESIRHYLGAFLVALGGIDVLVFTGGIGENSQLVRKGVCANLGWLGIELDEKKNAVRGQESCISTDQSKAQIWIVPTNEELIVARQTVEVLKGKSC